MSDTDPGATVGIAAAARILGVSRQRADQLSRQTGFPAPCSTTDMGRLWRRVEIETYHQQRKAATS